MGFLNPVVSGSSVWFVLSLVLYPVLGVSVWLLGGRHAVCWDRLFCSSLLSIGVFGHSLESFLPLLAD